jgi:Uma2 family endonuclease
MGAKALLWLRAGVRLVWLVFPEERTVEIWRDHGLVRTLTAKDDLSGEEILPGLVLPLTRLLPTSRNVG